ncbi:hypothetical protein PR003_g21784 [Phytophthora rubi]|uniref:Uncharacterized protein n=1 Tax=Phytophthora rubi TaxID=129364 RepID=A0A6A4DLQ3_9STRA|nr:hypothetical protein PR001_g20534 [Phytophthora rubi]KAE9304291.1 hypothetical protein PR003_g21784 [Phytophthora rubi]
MLADAKTPLKFLQSLRVKALLAFVGAMASVCVGWTSWLILLIVKPNETVNWVMKTEDFDNGSFWLMVDAPARVWIKIADLTVETLILCVILEDGSPIGLVVTFTAIVAMNAFSCAVMMFLPDSYAGLTEVIVDITFRLDYAKLSINMEIFPLGAFEREASVIANPVQTDIIYKTLKSLQISSVFLLISRVGTD